MLGMGGRRGLNRLRGAREGEDGPRSPEIKKRKT